MLLLDQYILVVISQTSEIVLRYEESGDLIPRCIDNFYYSPPNQNSLSGQCNAVTDCSQTSYEDIPATENSDAVCCLYHNPK